jgi:L-ascorbate metabolism protein UlaG (beta-lactamase superfamily)
MTPEEAAEAAKTIKAELTIPMHYGSGIGTVEEARKFSKLVPKGMRVEILDSIE